MLTKDRPQLLRKVTQIQISINVYWEDILVTLDYAALLHYRLRRLIESNSNEESLPGFLQVNTLHIEFNSNKLYNRFDSIAKQFQLRSLNLPITDCVLHLQILHRTNIWRDTQQKQFLMHKIAKLLEKILSNNATQPNLMKIR